MNEAKKKMNEEVLDCVTLTLNFNSFSTNQIMMLTNMFNIFHTIEEIYREKYLVSLCSFFAINFLWSFKRRKKNF